MLFRRPVGSEAFKHIDARRGPKTEKTRSN
jgi:hypothetical protein